jgi:hypothetical protein
VAQPRRSRNRLNSRASICAGRYAARACPWALPLSRCDTLDLHPGPISPPVLARAAPDLGELEPVNAVARRWPAILGAVLTLAMVAGLARELLGRGVGGLSQAMPGDPRYYLCFALLYLASPTGDFIIFRRLWGIPAAGFVALLKKRIANEVVFGYSGEAYFYAWAKARASMVAAPFAAVKDVSILSALAGNVVTLATVAVALPLGRRLIDAGQFDTLAVSTGVVVAATLPWLIFSRRVFSLPRAVLWWVFGIHCLRLLTGSVLIALAWHFALPGVSIGMWLVLAAGRLLVSRLPLVPNKDLIFANLAILLIGQDKALSQLVAVTAALTLSVHVVLIAGLGLWALLRKWR